MIPLRSEATVCLDYNVEPFEWAKFGSLEDCLEWLDSQNTVHKYGNKATITVVTPTGEYIYQNNGERWHV